MSARPPFEVSLMISRFAKRLSGLVLACAVGSGAAQAQPTTGYISVPAPLAPAPVASPAVVINDSYAPQMLPASRGGGCGNGDACAPGLWVNVDYLLYWIKDAPSPGIIALKVPLPNAPG